MLRAISRLMMQPPPATNPRMRTAQRPLAGIISRHVSTSRVMGHGDNSPIPYLGTLVPSVSAVMRERQMDPLEEALLMTKRGIRLPSPIGPGRLPLLKGSCQISSPTGRRGRSFLPPFHSCLSSLLVRRSGSALVERSASRDGRSGFSRPRRGALPFHPATVALFGAVLHAGTLRNSLTFLCSGHDG